MWLLIEIGLFLLLVALALRWFLQQWALAGVKTTEEKRNILEKKAKIVSRSNAKHKDLSKKKSLVKKFKS